MPRLIPQLNKIIAKIPENEVYRGPLVERRPTRKSRYNPNFRAPSFLWDQRKQSFLLDEESPIIVPRVHRRHKRSPPGARSRNDRVNRITEEDKDDHRTLTEQDRQWKSNPYLRMIGSPLRKCFVTERILPRDLLIRLSVQLLPETLTAKAATVLLPDGLQNPAYASQTYGFGNYVFCSKDVIPEIVERNSTTRIGFKALVHSRMTEHINHLLRLRILQELKQLLKRSRESFERGSSDTNIPFIRKLTREEWSIVKSTGSIPWEGAIALLIVPPIHKDPVTRKRPAPNMKSTPEPPDADPNSKLPRLHPLSYLLPFQASKIQAGKTSDEEDFFPEQYIPVYNGSTLMPSRGQRSALSQLLTLLCGSEYKAYSQGSDRQSKSISRKERWKIKYSHTYIIFSSSQTIGRVDTVPAAVALWRMRMWEGEGQLEEDTKASIASTANEDLSPTSQE